MSSAKNSTMVSSPRAAGPTACLCYEMVSHLFTTMQKSAAHPKISRTRSSSVHAKLLDDYTLGDQLGQGAFGVVYACKRKGACKDFAVKLIDKVEMPIEDIRREVEIQQRVAHPCVAKLHQVYYEKVFVCIVLELHKGGDLIDGLDRHWKNKGMLPTPVVQNLSKMMVQSVAWLHQHNVVHRDLKGDNFLMDRKAIEHPSCRIFLADFGTAVELEAGERLNSRCGTKLYWSPEFYDRNYGLAADMWAIGVITYGFVACKFPFKGEESTRSQKVVCPKRATPDGEDFILETLRRSETERLTAKQALDHVFLSSIRSAAQAADDWSDPEFTPALKETGATAGVQERRRELVERITLAASKTCHPAQGLATKYAQIKNGHRVLDKVSKKKVEFGWWSEAKVGEEKLIDFAAATAATEASMLANSGEEGIRQMLQEHGVQMSKFGQGQARELSELLREVRCGESRLMLDATKHKSVVRVVDVVVLRVAYDFGGETRYLVLSSEKYLDGRTRESNQLPGAKKLPHESARAVISRIMQDRLQDDSSEIVSFDTTHKELFEEDVCSQSYPGVRTVYRKEIYEGIIVTTDAKILEKLGLHNDTFEAFAWTCSKGSRRTYEWFTELECQTRKVVMRAPMAGAEVSPLVHVPICFSEEDLQLYLQTSNVDTARFGTDGVKTLKDFSDELSKGEAQLLRKADGSITRVVDVVVLRITRADGDVVVELPAAGAEGPGRLPAVKRRPDENPFWAAKRALNKVLKFSENLVSMDPHNVLFVEEEAASKAYLGLPTIYRKLIISASMQEN